MTVALTRTPVLQTARLTLRAPAARDWPACRAMLRSARSRFMRKGAMTEGEAWRAFGHVIGHWVLRGFGMFTITARGDDAALGMAGPWFPAGWPEGELAWSLWSAQAEGQGIAHEAVTATRSFAFSTLGWTSAVSYIDPDNARSIALAARLGAVIDPDAATPEGAPCTVYRHNATGEV